MTSVSQNGGEHLGSSPLSLSRHAALKTRAQGDVLVLPERAVRIGGSGGEILRLCEGLRDPRAIIDEMRRRYPEAPELETEVALFLREMLTIGALVREEGQDGESS